MKFIRAYHIQKNNESVVVTDCGEFPIWVKDFEKYFSSLCAGDEIAEEETLITLAVRRDVKKTAIRRLAAGDVTKKALSKKLMSKKVFGRYPEKEFVDSLLDKLEKAGYIDDVSFAKRTVNKCAEKNWGEMKIRAYMQEKGFLTEHINLALEEENPDFVGIAETLIKRDFLSCDKDTVYRRLYTRGFKGDEIAEALGRIEK